MDSFARAENRWLEPDPEPICYYETWTYRDVANDNFELFTEFVAEYLQKLYPEYEQLLTAFMNEQQVENDRKSAEVAFFEHLHELEKCRYCHGE